MDHTQTIRKFLERDKPATIPATGLLAESAVGRFRNAIEERAQEGKVILSFDENLMLSLRDRQFVRSRNEFDQSGERHHPRHVSFRRHWSRRIAVAISLADLVNGALQHPHNVIAARVVTGPESAEVSGHIALEILRVFEYQLFLVGTAGQTQPGCEQERRQTSGTWVAGSWQDSRFTYRCGVKRRKLYRVRGHRYVKDG